VNGVVANSDSDRTNKQQSSVSKLYARMNSILRLSGYFRITSKSFGLFIWTRSKWFTPASTSACILMTKLQSSSLPRHRNSECRMPRRLVIQSPKDGDKCVRGPLGFCGISGLDTLIFRKIKERAATSSAIPSAAPGLKSGNSLVTRRVRQNTRNRSRRV